MPWILRGARREAMRLGLRNSVLTDLVEQRFIANLQQSRRLLAVPIGLLQRLRNGSRLRFIFSAACQALQTARGGFHGSRRLGRRVQLPTTIQIVLRIQFRDGKSLIAENQLAFYEVAKLAQISRPGIFQASVHQCRRKWQWRTRIAFRHPAHEVL